ATGAGGGRGRGVGGGGGRECGAGGGGAVEWGSVLCFAECAVAWLGPAAPGGCGTRVAARGSCGARAGARRRLPAGPALCAGDRGRTGGGRGAAGAASGPVPVGTPLAHSNLATKGFECATLVRMRDPGRTGGRTVASFVVATAGHVDHGKSALVRALTGIEPDRLAEERRRGLTVDLGFAWTELVPGCDAAFVDVPGHERFLGNMLAGLGPAP